MTKEKFIKFISNKDSCADTTLNTIAHDCQTYLNTGKFPISSMLLTVIDDINDDVINAVSREFLKRNALPF